MSSTVVEVKPALLKWARERARVDVGRVRTKFPKFDDWMKGTAKPTLRQLEEYARLTLTPLGFFFLTSPPEERLPIADFRARGNAKLDHPSPNLLDTLYLIQRRQEWMSTELRSQGVMKHEFVGAYSLTSTPQEVAKGMKSTLGLVENWTKGLGTWTDAIRVLRDAAESAGILVFMNGIVGNNTHRVLDPEEFQGFALVDSLAPAIFINSADWKAAQMFTVAHELAHVWLGEEGVSKLNQLHSPNSRVEQLCNSVAAEFLVPESEIRKSWERAQHAEDPFQELAREFKVSQIVAARRAEETGLISREQFFFFYEMYNKRDREAPAKGGGDFWKSAAVRIGKRFGATLVHAAREGRITYTEAYDLAGLSGKNFETLALDVLGIGKHDE